MNTYDRYVRATRAAERRRTARCLGHGLAGCVLVCLADLDALNLSGNASLLAVPILLAGVVIGLRSLRYVGPATTAEIEAQMRRTEPAGGRTP